MNSVSVKGEKKVWIRLKKSYPLQEKKFYFIDEKTESVNYSISAVLKKDTIILPESFALNLVKHNPRHVEIIKQPGEGITGTEGKLSSRIKAAQMEQAVKTGIKNSAKNKRKSK